MKHPELLLLAAILVFATVLTFKGATAYGAPAKDSQAVLQRDPSAQQGILQAQLETMRQYDQRLLATVYWAFGSAFLLLVLVGGVNWFTNFRLYERERESLREAARTATQAELVALNAKFQEVHSSLEESTKKIGAELWQGTKAAAESIRASLKESLAQMKRREADFRATYYESVEQYSPAFQELTSYLEALEELDWLSDEFWVGKALDRMERVLLKRPTISYTQQGKIFAMLEKSTPILAGQVSKVRGLIEQSRHI